MSFLGNLFFLLGDKKKTNIFRWNGKGLRW
jgi:hypothetical protein